MYRFAIRVFGNTTMSEDQIESAFHNFLLEQQFLATESGDIHKADFDDVSLEEHEEDDEI